MGNRVPEGLAWGHGPGVQLGRESLGMGLVRGSQGVKRKAHHLIIGATPADVQGEWHVGKKSITLSTLMP